MSNNYYQTSYKYTYTVEQLQTARDNYREERGSCDMASDIISEMEQLDYPNPWTIIDEMLASMPGDIRDDIVLTIADLYGYEVDSLFNDSDE